jgi:hypothetical protein
MDSNFDFSVISQCESKYTSSAVTSQKQRLEVEPQKINVLFVD